jgi:hypothetical protein
MQRLHIAAVFLTPGGSALNDSLTPEPNDSPGAASELGRGPAIQGATRARRPWRLLLAARPEILFVPLAAVFLAVNVGPWGYGLVYVTTFFVYLSFQASNEIFPLTWSLAWILFVGVLGLLLYRRALTWWRSLLVAGTLPFLAIGIFEIPYDLAIWHFHPDYGVTPFVVLSISVWFTLGFTSVGWWRFTRLYWVLLGAYIAGYIGWAAVGFPTIYSTDPTLLGLAYGFNICLKVGCFALAGLPVFETLLTRRAES